ncbi:hypothetical protein PF008_g27228 [Phytophthora fragariae]|uniref:Uncharacterized protein n=1 Tax=Phytophthora fragariae TaxID=53985 RepID=A0A6G0QER5_9STRA|nr:hypothetical protein PF008_g27228 [Phytophthora fragariae]
MSFKRWADQVVESHSESKRVCIGLNGDCGKKETGLVLLARPHAKLKWANLPSRVMALSNVVERIEELALTPEESLEEAVRTGQVQLLSELATDFTGDVSGAVLAAARSGRTDMLEILLASQTEYFYDEETGCKYDEEEEYGQFVAEAAVAASREGHLEAVRLLHDIVYYHDDRYETLWKILEEAAASGHVHVVKYAVDSLRDVGDDEFMDCTADRTWKNCRALSLAISGGHVDVVEVLLDDGAPSGVWDVKDAFEQALKEGQEDVAWGIYEVFRDRLSGCEDADLIIQMYVEDTTPTWELELPKPTNIYYDGTT